jgi:hypothetical protein
VSFVARIGTANTQAIAVTLFSSLGFGTFRMVSIIDQVEMRVVDAGVSWSAGEVLVFLTQVTTPHTVRSSLRLLYALSGALGVWLHLAQIFGIKWPLSRWTVNVDVIAVSCSRVPSYNQTLPMHVL